MIFLAKGYVLRLNKGLKKNYHSGFFKKLIRTCCTFIRMKNFDLDWVKIFHFDHVKNENLGYYAETKKQCTISVICCIVHENLPENQ